MAVVAACALAAPAHADAFDRIHRGDTRTQVNHKLNSHGEPLGGYRDHGRHRVRRYPTHHKHVWIVVDYRVRPHHLRVWFKTRCTWDPDGVDCHPGAPS